MHAAVTTNEEHRHVPVLRDEAVSGLDPEEHGIVVDATYGRGGHTRAILARLGAGGKMLVIDRDPAAVAQARREWSGDQRIEIVHAPFSRLRAILDDHGLSGRVTGVLFDLGVSSPQLDDGSRGFGFAHDGPLDMRMDTESGITAADWLERVEQGELARVLRTLGEERFARRVASRIKAHGRFSTTGELAQVVAGAVPTREPGKHPATRTFQAIRIALNRELEELGEALPQAVDVLAGGGRLVVISFHSLEDRLVKRFIREQSRGDPYPPDLPVRHDMLRPRLRAVGKAVRAGKAEIAANRRARSAVMRVAEKVA